MISIDKESVVKKIVFFFLVGLCAWTFTKIPFLMAYSPIGDDDFNKAGVTATVNLVQMIHGGGGYHGNKVKSPAANFILVHAMFGITILIMIAMTLVKSSLRRKYGYATFTFTIIFGLHTFPAACQHVLWIPFCFTNSYVMVAALFGFRTLRLYDRNPAVCERHLEIEHYIIAFGAWGAGFTEIFVGIIPNIIARNKTGLWPAPNFEGPHPLAGHTLYDVLPESVGYNLFLALVAIVWVAWPMYLLTVETKVTNTRTNTHTQDEIEGLVK
jgi:hypothetical protein